MSADPEAPEKDPDAEGVVSIEASLGRAKLAPLVVDAAGLGEILLLSERTIYRLHDSGRIPAAIKLGSASRWYIPTIEEWLRAGAPPRRQWEARRA